VTAGATRQANAKRRAPLGRDLTTSLDAGIGRNGLRLTSELAATAQNCDRCLGNSRRALRRRSDTAALAAE